MRKYVILMDASGDIEKKIVDKYDLKFIPMQYSLGEEMRTSYGNEDDATMKKFYDGQRNGDMTRTSQITPFMYEEYFEKYLKEGYCVLYLALSSGLSSTYSAACLAGESLKEKYPLLDVYSIDSLTATGCMGVLIERALKNREKGMSIEDNRDDILSVVPKTKCWFLVQDLMYLKRGGRISSTTAFVGSMLSIKPILKINEEGKLITIAKKRGNNAAINALFDYFNNSRDENVDDVVYVCNADCQDLANDLVALVKKAYPNLEIRQTTLCPIIGAHTGPGMLALCHISK